MPREHPTGEVDQVVRGPGFGATTAITVALGLAGVVIAICAVTLVVQPKPIPGLQASQRQDAETALYLLALALMGLAVLAGPRVTTEVASGPNRRGLPALAALLTGTLGVIVLAARGLDAVAGGGTEALLVAALAWAAAATAALARARRAPEWGRLLALAPHTRMLWAGAALILAVAPLAVVHPRSLSLVPLALGALGVAVWARTVGRGSLPRPSPRVGLAIDLALVVLLLLVIPDLVVVRPEDPGLGALDRYLASIMQFHHDFLLGPANQVLAGDTLLRDTASQYGVGSIYFLVGWFKLTTISYGSLALLDGLLTAALFASVYAVLRMAGCSRLLAGGAMGVAVVALVFNRVYPVGMLPQEGPFRFGLPMLVVLATVAAARWPLRARIARGSALVVVGISAIWALEAFAATIAVFAALACFEAYQCPPGERVRRLLRRLWQALAAAALAHVLFAAITLVATGSLPDWGQYLAFLHQFLFGGLGDLTYDFSRWSPGLALGAAYLTAATLLLLVLRLRPAVVAGHPAAFTALTGVTAYGLVQFAYFVDRSADHVVVYVALPAVAAAVLWLSLALREPERVSRDTLMAAVVVSGVAAVLLVSTAWASIRTPLSRSALSQLIPGGDSLRGSIARLRAFPAINGRAPEGERMLDVFMPGERQSVVITEPDLAVEILVRRQRGNALPISDPREDDFTYDERLPGLLRAVRDLRPGRRMLVDAGALSTLAAVRRNPRSRLLTAGGGALSSLQARALQAIDRRFRLRVVRREAGFVVLELARR